ncbi:MAG: hypothetical protein K0B00_14065 [Rhodobacteraceae bacterium]|nr:hypothetical protein [Paracoccaceae bacterium]
MSIQGKIGHRGAHVGTATARAGAACMVSLIDRRTGRAHTVGGAPLRVFTKLPEEAAATLLRQRDPAHWEVRVEPLMTIGPRS